MGKEDINTPRNLRSGELPYRGLKSNLLKSLAIGSITRVDYEKGVVDISWLNRMGERTNVNITAPFSTARSKIVSIPEVGTLVVCGWVKLDDSGLERPIILQYYDVNYEKEIEYRLRRGKASSSLNNIESIQAKLGYDLVRSKRRKIYPGEIYTESTQGSEMYLDDNVYLSNKSLNEIEIVSADQSIRCSSRQQYHQTSASRTWNGLITREPINIQFQPTTLPNGQQITIITETGNPFHLGGRAFTEYRIETYEKSDGFLNVTEVNSGKDITELAPYMTFMMGTLVGNDKTDLQRYGKVLRPQIFGTADAAESKVDELECLPSEMSTLAGAFQLKSKSGATVTIDKQGHLFTYFPAGTGAHPLGGGRSWEGAFAGAIKLTVGADSNRSRSITLDTKGGVKEVLGYDSLTNRSKETIAQKAIYNEVQAADADGNAFIFRGVGNVLYDIKGNYNVNITGDYVVTVNGKIQENIMGTKTENYIEDKNNVYGANYKELVLKHKDVSIGSGQKVTITGVETEFGKPPVLPASVVDELAITLGSRKETYTAGNLKRYLLVGDMTADLTAGNTVETIILGSHKEAITTGDHSETIITGSHKETITTGDHSETIVTGGHKEVITTGDHSETVTTGSHKETIVTGSHKEVITTGDHSESVTTGSHKETIVTGSHKEVITTGDHSENVTTGSHKETVVTGSHKEVITTGDHSESITTGSHKESIVTGSHTETIKVGSHKEDVTTGDHSEIIKVGSHKEDITTGNHQVTIKAGNFKVDIKAGNVEVTTKAGNIKIQTTAGKVDVMGMLQVTVKSGVKLVLSGPQVEIGALPLKGGVVTGTPGMFSHLDYICGIPLQSSKTVKASI